MHKSGMRKSTNLLAHPFLHQITDPSIHQPIHSSIHPSSIHLSIHLPICSPTYELAHLPICPPAHQVLTHSPIHATIYAVTKHPSTSPFIDLPNYLFIYESIHQPVHPTDHSPTSMFTSHVNISPHLQPIHLFFNSLLHPHNNSFTCSITGQPLTQCR